MRIDLEGVCLSFGDRKLFDGLSIVLSSGKTTAVVGANGSGKSTLLRLIGGFVRPDDGVVRVLDGDRELTRLEYRRRLAVSAPSMRLYNRLTAEENLRFFAGLRGVGLGTIEVMLERVGLSVGDGKKFLSEYSTGMEQRLKMAIVLVVGADVWLLDEPGSNLDGVGRAMVRREIERGASDGKLIVLATNDPEEAAVADEKIKLN